MTATWAVQTSHRIYLCWMFLQYRHITPSEYEEVKTRINQLLEAQIIRESSSPYASAIVLVRKKDGSQRLCVDYTGWLSPP
ncbi:hypothetical protein F2P81_001347 [Scophthalmus maximus]|uniref:Reverse transcriptase/retrotransposon-derived protein RNase H-like domain-containing protein n=1 Tax=Scophthalmus maximus TaxID=52904 RepID=A0A6A4TX32_SCOMX|nr:hypothetical protein F2P81_001347 [Scophthalmus maximus]